MKDIHEIITQVLKIFLFLFLFIQTSNSAKIAICISGPFRGFYPQFLVNHLIKANPEHSFVVFAHLVPLSHNSSWNTTITEAYSPLTRLSQQEFVDVTNSLFTGFNVELSSVEFLSHYSHRDVMKHLKTNKPLDRITVTNDRAFTLFLAQEKCLKKINEYEKAFVKTIDYVINTQENLYYFHNLSMTPFLQDQIKPTRIMRNTEASTPFKCHIYVKDCLKFNGVNLKWQFFSRANAMYILPKFSFYKNLLEKEITTRNHETFEKLALKQNKMNICEFSSDLIPTMPIRRWSQKDSSVCFNPVEVKGKCYPEREYSFIEKHMCSGLA
jgi:hypothetical protein